MKPRSQNAIVIAGRVRQKRQVHRTSVFVIVEGLDDKKFYLSFLDRERCRIEVAYGRPNVEAALAILEADCIPDVLAIVDSDFDILDGKPAASPNLFRTDTHDIETMMLVSPALDKLLREHADEEHVDMQPSV